MNLSESLQQHLALCEEIHRLFLEENRLLQSTRKPPGDSFLARKRDLLPRLDAARLALGVGKLEPDAKANEAAIDRLQKKILSLLLLDRENEKLLLKYSVQADAFKLAAKPRTHLVARAYSSVAA